MLVVIGWPALKFRVSMRPCWLAQAGLDLLEEPDVLSVAGFVGFDVPPNRFSQKIEIPEDIQNFVAGEFIFKPKLGVQDFLVPKENKIVQFPTRTESHFSQLRDFLDKTEGAGWSDFPFEALLALKLESVIHDANGFGVFHMVSDF